MNKEREVGHRGTGEAGDIEGALERGVPLAPYTSFRIGGPARFFMQPRSIEQFGDTIAWALKRSIPFFVLGGGANVLVHERGFDGLIIHTGKLQRIDISGTTLQAECGVHVDALVDAALDQGLAGLEFAAGLPGTVGGALFMNARAYEGEFSKVVASVRALKVRGRKIGEDRLLRDELAFSYKHSLIQRGGLYVYSARFELEAGERDGIAARIADIRSRRLEAGQFFFPNAGCIFKNRYDIGKSTGRIIDELGLKGTRIGDAEVYQKHANFIVNRGAATADDVYRLIRLIEAAVARRLGLRIEREIRLIGPWCEDDT
jgi:UDP-N-acetylmuramate dehydrogenase